MRTGTHNEPIHTNANGNNGMARGSALGASSFDGLKAPAVWRRESASDTVRALEKNGMETYDIPAFLRKQAD
jgi:cell division protein FtsZ